MGISRVLELNAQELKYLLCSVKELSRAYVFQGGSRDYNTEDLHDAVKKKLETALGSFE